MKGRSRKRIYRRLPPPQEFDNVVVNRSVRQHYSCEVESCDMIAGFAHYGVFKEHMSKRHYDLKFICKLERVIAKEKNICLLGFENEQQLLAHQETVKHETDAASATSDVSVDRLHANLEDPDVKTVAGSAFPDVSVDWLHANLKDPDVKVLDASWYMPDEKRNPFYEYQVSHIPGALFFDVDGISDRASNFPHMLPSEDAFAAAVSALGIENKDGLIVYDGKGLFSAARVWWMFRAFGHDRVWVLDGGLPQWRAAGFDVESSASGDLKASAVEKVYDGQTVAPAVFQTKYQPHLVWTLEQVKGNIEDQIYQHIDARSKARFDGIAPEPRKGIRSGHVPGSKCIPFGEMLDDSQNLLPADKLKEKFERQGISLNSPVVTSCCTGITACILALGLHRLGKDDVAVYDGSWTEWGAHSDTPVSTS